MRFKVELVSCCLLLIDVLSTEIVHADKPYMEFCRNDLGMNSGAIPSESLSASSSYDEKSVGPQNSRIRHEDNGGAWCPKNLTNKELREWLQIDLQDVKVISLVETQGRFGNGQGQEFVPNYVLEYQRRDNGTWMRYRDKRGNELIKGNSNTYIAELRELRPPIIAKRVRFLPWSNHPRTTCLRVELYGCHWTDGVLSYSMRQGDKNHNDLDLYDLSYDGQNQSGILSGGLGQLTDFEDGGATFGKRSSEWVGWRNDDTNSTQPLEIVFEFDRLRYFTKVQIYASNIAAREVGVFKRLVVAFSFDGFEYGNNSVVFNYTPVDPEVDIIHNVVVPVPTFAGRFVKLTFFFESRWMAISEIRFSSGVSQVLNSSVLEIIAREDKAANLVAEQSGNLLSTVRQRTSDEAQHEGLDRNLSWILKLGPVDDRKASLDPKTSKSPTYDTNIGIIVGTISGFLTIVVVFFVVMFLHRRRQALYSKGKSSFKSPLFADPRRLSSSSGLGNSFSRAPNSQTQQSVVAGRKVVDAMRNTDLKLVETDHSLDHDRPSEAGSSQVGIYEIPLNFPLSARSCTALPFFPSNEPAVSILAASALHSTLKGTVKNGTQDKKTSFSTVSSSPSSLASSDSSNPPPSWSVEATVPEILLENLSFIEKLGNGSFGEVHLCQLNYNQQDKANADSTQSCKKSQMVAVKVLHESPSEQEWMDFQKEIIILSQINDPNILRLLGTCTRNGVPAVVLEYMINGDLVQFLQDSLLDTSVPESSKKRCLSYGSLIYMAMQIASGMKYLESRNFVHRDLAARNCLVGQQYTVKIADFGMSRSIYSNDYADNGGSKLLPIRWMAWESILLGRFSCKSDVWSFGVTLWEILGLARESPFDSFTNDEVVENCEHIRSGDGQEQWLTQPAICPKEIYDLMLQCWNREETQRPTFREIHMFLEHRNSGYDPETVEDALSEPVE